MSSKVVVDSKVKVLENSVVEVLVAKVVVDEFGKMVVLIKGAVVVVGTNVDDDKFVLGVQVVLNPVDVSVHAQVVLVEGQLV